MSVGPQSGDKAPDFDLPGDEGGEIRLKDFAGRKLALYFYPKDDTPGCTTEAQAFSASAADFEAAGVAVVGVSKDTVKSHARFRQKYGLNLRLGADVEGKTVEAYGVWVEKSLYGRKYMGIERATFLIDGKGVVRRVWRKVSVKGHAEDVLSAARSLSD
jgi:peroxiredoxin